MKYRKIHILLPTLIVILYCLFSCKKECPPTNNPSIPNTTLYDTIFPLDYFPAFPGSYWRYVNSNNDTSLITTEPEYQKDYYTQYASGYVSDTFLVPIYKTHMPIWGYEAHTGPISHSGSYPLTRILSDSLPVGSSWIIYSWGGEEKSRKIIAKDNTIIISGVSFYPTIVVEEYYSHGPPGLYLDCEKILYKKHRTDQRRYL